MHDDADGLWAFAVYAAAACLSLVLTGCGGGGGGDAGSNASGGTATWSVTPAGGTFQTTDGRASLSVPPNAVAATTTVTPQLLGSAGTLPLDHQAVDGTPVQFNPIKFAVPATLRLRIPASVADADLSFVRIFRRADGSGTWQAFPTTVDTASRIAQAQVSEFSGYGVFTANIGPNEWAMDAAGGTFSGANGRIGLVVTAGSIANAYRVRYTPIALTDMGDPPAGWQYVAGSAYDFVWSDTTTRFNPAATYRVSFAGLNLSCDPSLLAVFTRQDFGDQQHWTQVATGIDVAGRVATTALNQLRQHALFCPEPALPIHMLLRTSTRNNGQEETTLAVSKFIGGALVSDIARTYVSDLYSQFVHMNELIVFSGAQVSRESLYVVTGAFDFSITNGEKQLVALNLRTNSLEVIDAIPGPVLQDFDATVSGISADASVIAAKFRELDPTAFTPRRRSLRLYERQTRRVIYETELAANDVSNVEAVSNNGVVALSDARSGGSKVTIIKNGSVRLQATGLMPRLNPQGSKAYIVNDQGQLEEHDLASGQSRVLPIGNPVDYAIETGGVVHFKPTATGCQLVRADLLTGQETVLAAAADCANQHSTGSAPANFMLR